jgi:hypothetical protein
MLVNVLSHRAGSARIARGDFAQERAYGLRKFRWAVVAGRVPARRRHYVDPKSFAEPLGDLDEEVVGVLARDQEYRDGHVG